MKRMKWVQPLFALYNINEVKVGRKKLIGEPSGSIIEMISFECAYLNVILKRWDMGRDNREKKNLFTNLLPFSRAMRCEGRETIRNQVLAHRISYAEMVLMLYSIFSTPSPRPLTFHLLQAYRRLTRMLSVMRALILVGRQARIR